MALERSGRTWQMLTDYICQIHVDNPSSFTLCGTNTYVIGRGPVRTLVDPGDFPESNAAFMENFNNFLDANSGVKIDRILVTHGHHDHFGGVHDTIKLLEQRQRTTGDLLTYKHLTGNSYEEETFDRYPDLRNRVHTISDGQVFQVGDEALSI